MAFSHATTCLGNTPCTGIHNTAVVLIVLHLGSTVNRGSSTRFTIAGLQLPRYVGFIRLLHDPYPYLPPFIPPLYASHRFQFQFQFQFRSPAVPSISARYQPSRAPSDTVKHNLAHGIRGTLQYLYKELFSVYFPAHMRSSIKMLFSFGRNKRRLHTHDVWMDETWKDARVSSSEPFVTVTNRQHSPIYP